MACPPASTPCLPTLLIALLAWTNVTHLSAHQLPATPVQTIVDIQRLDDVRSTPQDAQLKPITEEGRSWLQVTTGHKANWPGVTLQPVSGVWDLSGYSQICLQVRNCGAHEVTVNCRIDSAGGDGQKNSITDNVQLQPGETKELCVPVQRRLDTPWADKLLGMRGYPGGYAKDRGLGSAKLVQLILFVNKPQRDHQFLVADIRATGMAQQPTWLEMPAEEFFPMIDEFGQFLHSDWPGKVHALSELRTDIDREDAQLESDPAPAGWTQYGGWQAGPQREATGYFRTEKLQGQWWLVDPEGRLFWSHGVDCVGFANATTPITDREFYFAELPRAGSPESVFFGQASWAPHGYYEGKGRYRTFNFTAANLQRKFGELWRDRAIDLAHRRLRSWGLNTIGNWSDASIYLEKRTPYVATVGSNGAKRIEGSSGYWGKFPDPFDRSFSDQLRREMQRQQASTAGDPWCIGYFVDNELAWGDQYALATAALASPAEQAAKQAFLADLQTKYESIDKLNAAWQSNYASWQALLASREPPAAEAAADDLGAFCSRIAEQYFQQCRSAVKAVAPQQLYLGCRFAWVNDRGARAAAKYCDVIGYNLYRDSVADFRLPEGVDKPVIIGEFHFGALDRGMFHTGLRPTDSQQARADAYRDYVTGALRNPYLVGTHWFQYGDQATTGRGDGENYQIGLVTVCDRPYPETIQAVRTIGRSMYQIRLAAGQ